MPDPPPVTAAICPSRSPAIIPPSAFERGHVVVEPAQRELEPVGLARREALERNGLVAFGDRHDPPGEPPPGRRYVKRNRACVRAVAPPFDQTVFLHVVDQACERGDLDGGGLRQIAHAPAVLVAQGRQYPPDLQRSAERPHLLAERG